MKSREEHLDAESRTRDNPARLEREEYRARRSSVFAGARAKKATGMRRPGPPAQGRRPRRVSGGAHIQDALPPGPGPREIRRPHPRTAQLPCPYHPM